MKVSAFGCWLSAFGCWLLGVGFCAAGALDVVHLSAGDQSAGGAGRAVAVQAMSTNLAGTLTVSRVTPFSLSWTETETVAATNWTYEPVSLRTFVSNIVTETVEDGVTNWLTNAVYRMEGGIATNAHVTTYDVRRLRNVTLAETNALCALTLAGGFAATNLTGITVFPGDFLTVSGTALPGGRAMLIMER